MSTWTLPGSINLIRYLIALRVTHSLVILPPYLPAELSYALGAMITERLPTSQTKHWRKMVTAWEQANQGRKKGTAVKIPNTSWPLESALLAYPGKHSYGKGELIFFELKLFGDSAAHSLFLEMLLPTLEDAGVRPGADWQQLRSLWGRYEVHAVYAARGKKWEPVVADGNLDLSYRPTPNQWAEGLSFGQDLGISYHNLIWLTPFCSSNTAVPRHRSGNRPTTMAPTLPILLQELLSRLQIVGNGRLHDEAETAVNAAMQENNNITMETNNVNAPPKHWPGTVWGQQRFSTIPVSLLPYLELASILHIGKHTHLGCGAFKLM